MALSPSVMKAQSCWSLQLIETLTPTLQTVLPAHTNRALSEGLTCLPALAGRQLTVLSHLPQWGHLLQPRAWDIDQAWTEVAEWSLQAFPLSLQVVSGVHHNEETELPVAIVQSFL